MIMRTVLATLRAIPLPSRYAAAVPIIIGCLEPLIF
jgi:hypothetical protein